MTMVSFPNWKEVLESSDLESGVRKSFEISIKWYLGYLGKHKEPATVENARRFVREMVSERRPADWMVEQWREALNWFFRNAPRRRRCASMAESTGKSGATAERKAVAKVGAKAGIEAGVCGETCVEAEAGVEMVGDGRRRYAVTIREYQESVAWEPWIEETVRLMRVRQMAYRTEETYIGWMRRIARFGECRGKSLEDFGEGDLKDFLSYLAVEEGVSASTQRQALNAGVFFLREVRKLELGDFSDFVKADPRKYYPVVYTREEMGKVLA